jgi:hypothetical protein
MITAFQLILTPFKAWGKINSAQWGVFKIFLLFLVPLLVLTVGLEGLALSQWGEPRGELGFIVKVSRDLAIRYSAAQLALLMTSIFLGAKFLQWITHSFQVYTSYKQCFTLMAYGFSPIILLRLIDAIPKVNTWVCWGLGALLSIAVLYQGVGLILRPEQTKGFGLYLVSVIIVVLSGGLSHFVAVAILHGKILR